MVGGGQQYRAVQLLFDDDYIYYGTDTPLERNCIYRIARDDQEAHPQLLQEVSSSIFYGARIGGNLFFATVVEPSQVNLTSKAEVWGSEDGRNWHLIVSHRKDIYPLKLFQYGQFTFPLYLEASQNLWFYSMSLDCDGKSFCISTESIFK